MNEMLTFSSERITDVINVTIIDDEIYEDDEQLFFVLESEPSDVNIVFSPRVAMLTIVDNDSKERNLCLL